MNWQQDLPTFISPQLQPWLVDTGSMTARFKHIAGNNFSVTLLNEAIAKIDNEDYSLLKIPNTEPVRVRQIYLCRHQQPWIYGKTLLPQSTIDNTPYDLANLGTKPIGSVLFANHAKRSSLSFCLLSADDFLYQQAVANLNEQPKNLWARRSIFTLQNYPLLIYEVFLPALCRYASS